ncbi:MAG: phosphotransferase [Alicyclobacillaceae bacterium]|nr:phosphotransferase [Alicyclobacillaceae bacterium]
MRHWGYDPNVLFAYPYVFTRASRHGNAIRLQSARATIVLKRTPYSPLQLEAMHDVLADAERRGAFLPRWIMPRHPGSARASQTPFVRGADGLYYAVEWLEGRRVNLASVADMSKACESLSRFHDLTRRWAADPDTGETRRHLPDAFDIVDRLSRRAQELERVLKRSETARESREADLFYLEHAPVFIAQAHEALDWLLAPDCQKRLEQERESPTVCHMDLTSDNLVRKDNRIYLVDFDYLACAPRTLDLAHLLRRGLQKGGWLPELGLTGLLHYNTACTLTRAEYLLLRAFLTFPHRWWRATHRWQSGERSTDGVLRDLRRCVQEEPARSKFLQWFRRHAVGR